MFGSKQWIVLYCQPRLASAVMDLIREVHGKHIRICVHPTHIKRARRLQELVESHKRAFVYVSAEPTALAEAVLAGLHFGVVCCPKGNGPELWHAKWRQLKQVAPQLEPESQPEVEVDDLAVTEAAELIPAHA